MRTNFTGFVAAFVRRKLPISAAIIALFPAIGWSQAYTVINLGTLGGDYTTGFAVNDAGEVVGNSDGQTGPNQTSHPFLYKNGTMIDLGTFGGLYGAATGINQNGVVSGSADDSNEVSHTFVWNGTMQELDPSESYGGSINASNQINGSEGYGGAIPTNNPVLYTGGSIEAIPFAPYSGFSSSGINDSGQMSGECYLVDSSYRACISNGVTVKPFKPLVGRALSQGSAINSQGHLCGASFAGTQPDVATLWETATPIAIGPAKAPRSFCQGLNDFDESVGFAASTGDAGFAFLWDAVNGARNLNSLVASHASYTLYQAIGISNTGYIITSCIYAGGHIRACLLKPNTVDILKLNILTVVAGSPDCYQCRTVLAPLARKLPNSLVDLSAKNKRQVLATIDSIGNEILTIERGREIPQPKASLLIHEAQLVLAALETRN